jgi:hypothetical protein
MEPFGNTRSVPLAGPAGGSTPGRQIDQEEVYRPGLKERASYRQPFVQVGRREDDQPLELHSSRHGFDGIQAPREIEIGNDPPGSLCLCSKAEGEGGLAARMLPEDRQARLPRYAPWSENRVECRKAGPNDMSIVCQAFRDLLVGQEG